ncbi:MAG: cupin domain-containing protein [Planctomycetota bacterium]
MGKSERYMVARLGEIDPVECPCGMSRRAFVSPDNPVATIHMVDIRVDSKAHYHKKLTEIYLVLEGEGHLELDGEMVPVGPMSTALIKPGCRHRAVGEMRIVNIPVPAFDPSDEWFDSRPARH